MRVLQEDPEVTEFKKAAADTAHDVKKSVDPNDQSASKPSSNKTVLESVSLCPVHMLQLTARAC